MRRRPQPSTSLSQTPRLYPYAWFSKAIVLAIAVAILGTGFILYLFQHFLVVQSGESLKLTSQSIANSVDQVLFERYGDIQVLSEAVGETVAQQASVAKVVLKFKEIYPIYSVIHYADRRGILIASTDSSELKTDVSRAAWFQDTVTAGTIQVLDYDVLSRAQVPFAVTFAAPVKGLKGEFVGVVQTAITAQSLEQVVFAMLYRISQETSLFKSAEFQVLSAGGKAFIDSGNSRGDDLVALGVASAKVPEIRETGWIEEEHLRRQVPVVTGFATMHGRGSVTHLPWRVLIRVDRQDVLAPIRRIVLTGVGGQVALFIPLCGVLLWASRKIQDEWNAARTAEKHAQDSEHRIRQTIEGALDAVIVLDAEGRVDEWNEQAGVMFGWRAQEIKGQFLSETLVPPASRAAHRAALQRVVDFGQTSVLERRLELPALHRDGRELFVEIAVTKGVSERRPFFTAFLRDITMQKEKEKRLAAQYEITKVLASTAAGETAYTKIISIIGDSLNWDVGELWFVEDGGEVLRRGTAWHRLAHVGDTLLADTGGRVFTKGAGLPGRVWENATPMWIPQLSLDENLPRRSDFERAGLQCALAFPLKTATGEVLGVLALFSQHGRPPDGDLLNMLESIGRQIGMFLINRRAEDALRKSETLFVSVVDRARDAIIAINRSQRVMLFNQGAVRIFGYETAEVVGQPIEMLLPERFRKNHQSLVEQLFTAPGLDTHLMGGAERMVLGRRKNGDEFPAEASIGMIDLLGEQVASIVLRDISERKKIEVLQGQYRERLEHDIAVRTADLEQAKTVAESANRTKSEFLANMSHELRTPMHAILSFANLSIEKLDKQMPEKVSQYLLRIRESGTRLLRLLNDLLDLSKLDAGKMTYEMKPQDMEALVRTTLEQLDPLIQQKSITLSVQGMEERVTTSCDAARMTQVLNNLLSNAIKFTPEGRTITIALSGQMPPGMPRPSADSQSIAVTVSDEGVGIPESEVETIFDPFVQSSKTKNGAGGTGLGLAICREIVRAHGGDIMARNNPGGGASLTFTLPRGAAIPMSQES